MCSNGILFTFRSCIFDVSLFVNLDEFIAIGCNLKVDIRAVTTTPPLTILWLSSNNLTEAYISNIDTLTNLEDLDLTGSYFPDFPVFTSALKTNLIYLYIESSEITAVDVSRLLGK